MGYNMDFYTLWAFIDAYFSKYFIGRDVNIRWIA